MDIPREDQRLSEMYPELRLSTDEYQPYQSRSLCTSPCTNISLIPDQMKETLSDTLLHDSVTSELCRSHSLSPDLSKFRSKLERLKIDVAKIGHRFHHSKDSLSGQRSLSSNSFTRNTDRSESPEPRRITIACSDASHDSKHSILSDYDFTDDWDVPWDVPDHNFTSSLMITSLQEGYFTAEISLQQIPMDNLVICVSGHELEIMVDKTYTPKHGKKHKISVPYHYGVVDLPIFVDMSSLVFAQDSDRNILIVQGETKGCFARRRSISYNMLPLLGNSSKETASSKWKRLLRKIGLRRTKSQGTVVAEWKTLVGSTRS